MMLLFFQLCEYSAKQQWNNAIWSAINLRAYPRSNYLYWSMYINQSMSITSLTYSILFASPAQGWHIFSKRCTGFQFCDLQYCSICVVVKVRKDCSALKVYKKRNKSKIFSWLQLGTKMKVNNIQIVHSLGAFRWKRRKIHYILNSEKLHQLSTTWGCGALVRSTAF